LEIQTLSTCEIVMDTLELCVLLNDAEGLKSDESEYKEVALLICEGKLSEAFEWTQRHQTFRDRTAQNIKGTRTITVLTLRRIQYASTQCRDFTT
jgi:predicted nucleotidyltransferase